MTGVAYSKTLLVSVPPADPTVVTVSDLKRHLLITHDDDDVKLAGLEQAAVSLVERYTRRTLLESTLVYKADRFPSGCRKLYLRRPPFLQVGSILYVEPDGTGATLTPDKYQVGLEGRLPFLVPAIGQSWPATNGGTEAVTVTWQAGFESRADVPHALRLAVQQLVGHWYENAEPVLVGTTANQLPFQVQALCTAYRVPELR